MKLLVSCWYFNEGGDMKCRLRERSAGDEMKAPIYVSKDITCLEQLFLKPAKKPMSVDDFVWKAFQKLIGGFGGVRRLASLYHARVEDARANGQKNVFNFSQNVFGKQFFEELLAYLVDLCKSEPRLHRLTVYMNLQRLVNERLVNWIGKEKASYVKWWEDRKEQAEDEDQELESLVHGIISDGNGYLRKLLGDLNNEDENGEPEGESEETV